MREADQFAVIRSPAAGREARNLHHDIESSWCHAAAGGFSIPVGGTAVYV